MYIYQLPINADTRRTMSGSLHPTDVVEILDTEDCVSESFVYGELRKQVRDFRIEGIDFYNNVYYTQPITSLFGGKIRISETGIYFAGELHFWYRNSKDSFVVLQSQGMKLLDCAKHKEVRINSFWCHRVERFGKYIRLCMQCDGELYKQLRHKLLKFRLIFTEDGFVGIEEDCQYQVGSITFAQANVSYLPPKELRAKLKLVKSGS